MDNKYVNGVLTIYLDDHLDSSNVDNVRQYVQEKISENPTREVYFDCEKLCSITAEGYELIKDIKKEFEVYVLNVSDDMYSKMDADRFTRDVHVRRKMRCLSAKDLEIIGVGASSYVHRYDDDTMIKAFFPAVSLDRIYAETESARKSLVAGINTAIPFDICRCDDGYATLFELIEGGSLGKNLMEQPEAFDEFMTKYIALLKQFHTTPAEMGAFPDIRDKYHGWMDGLKKYMTEEEVSQLYELFDVIPFRQTMIHVDPHVGNIMVDENRELIFVDMADISIGHPLIDVGTEYFHYIISRETCLGAKLIFAVEPEDHELPVKVWNALEKGYFAGKSEEQMKDIHNMLKYFGGFRCLIIVAKHAQLADDVKMELVEKQRKELMPFIDEAKELFARADEFFTD